MKNLYDYKLGEIIYTEKTDEKEYHGVVEAYQSKVRSIFLTDPSHGSWYGRIYPCGKGFVLTGLVYGTEIPVKYIETSDLVKAVQQSVEHKEKFNKRIQHLKNRHKNTLDTFLFNQAQD